jgi:hypothetical protein
MYPCQHSLEDFGFTGCQQEKDVTGRDEEQLWLQGICEEVVVLFLLFFSSSSFSSSSFFVVIIVVVICSHLLPLQTITW